MNRILPYEPGSAWIDDLTDDQCLEILWLYLDDPDTFFAQHPKALLGQALRYALRHVLATQGAGPVPDA